MPAVDAEMIFITKGRDCEINPRYAIRARFGLGVLDRPARIAILLAQLGGLLRPRRWDAALLDLALLAVGVALLWRGDDRGVDDLAAHRQKPGRRQRRLKALKQNLDRRFGWILARVNASRKVQIVFASGTVSASPSPRKRMKDSRSRIRYSVRSSDRLWLACR